MSDAIIGTLHWDACDTCVHDDDKGTGCPVFTDSSLENYMFDFVTCADYEAVSDE